ncbi:hypothetical protein KIN20_029317 [Parelaphostrongylus tenuis]|uniref:Uncharacterized protein n=1 Tax=Parelaphostrongylus tenuis TaxID=148309 RepID=A0AAD5R2E2_PARTN|nr:hypothetical protein KIN20_029317 [Parelaphostrongylus tenuis]
MTILTNKAGPSSAPFLILLLMAITIVFWMWSDPWRSNARFPSNLPIIAVYTENNEVSALIPGIATSKGAVQALAQRFAMQTVIDVLEIEGRRARLPDFVISNIMGQLQVNTTYEPLLCENVKTPEIPQNDKKSCITVGGTVTGICPAMAAGGCRGCRLFYTTNIIMANWSRLMWQDVVDRALRLLRSGPFGSHLYTVTVTVN